MSGFPRPDYDALRRYDPGRSPVDVDLSDNTNLWGAPPAALDVLRAAGVDDVARYPTLYADELRDAVATRFGVDAACVTTGVGSDDVLDSAWRAAFRAGASVSYPAPTFSMIEPFCLMNGLRADPVAWSEAVAEPARLLREDPALVYLCTPNNPTGALLSADWFDDFLARRAPDGPLVIVDEAYADFAGTSWIDRAVGTPGVLVVRTFSKAYGLAGLRCGFGIGEPSTVEAVDKSRGPYKVAGLVARAAAAALRDETGWVSDTIESARRERDRLCTVFDERGIRYLPSAANFVMVAAPTGNAAADADALRERGVGVRPFRDVPEFGEGLRVSVGPWPLLERFLDAWETLR